MLNAFHGFLHREEILQGGLNKQMLGGWGCFSSKKGIETSILGETEH
jgi:hypothetical protein